jgi:ubiquitin carboxyl-terminal hydrolase 4/11
LSDIYNSMKHERMLVLAIVFKPSSEVKFEFFSDKRQKFDADDWFAGNDEADQKMTKNKKSSGSQLSDCFEAFRREETLGGNDQFYCRKCKEHRDIHKKLELYKVPKIMVIQMKRF